MVMTDEDLLKLMIKILTESKETKLRLPALRFIGNICADDDKLVRSLLKDYKILEPLKETIQDKNSFLRKESCWVISNII